MNNLHTLRYFMRYYEPHCLQKDGKTRCYVSALEYPDADEALEVFGGTGFYADAPRSIKLKYASLVGENGNEYWLLEDSQKPGAYPVWVAW